MLGKITLPYECFVAESTYVKLCARMSYKMPVKTTFACECLVAECAYVMLLAVMFYGMIVKMTFPTEFFLQNAHT